MEVSSSYSKLLLSSTVDLRVKIWNLINMLYKFLVKTLKLKATEGLKKRIFAKVNKTPSIFAFVFHIPWQVITVEAAQCD